jgi:xanthine/CO dehydrogenase XdhC/CoxF family maturation factor
LRGERRAILVTVFRSRDVQAPVGARLVLDEQGKVSADSLSGASWAALAQAAELALKQPNRRPRLITSEHCDALLEVIEPPPHLFVFGAGPDALPLVQLASATGFGVTVYDTNARMAVRDRFAGQAELHAGRVEAAAALIAARRTPIAVVMSHHYPTDRQALKLLLDSKTPYIGVLGPLRRTERMLHELFPDPTRLTEADRSRVRAPLGLDLGAETPAQIALAAVAEIQAVLAHASALPLSQRGALPIHRPLTELSSPSLPELGKTGTA